MSNKTIFILFVTLLMAAVTPAMGAILEVPTNYATIALAYAAAGTGDTIWIRPNYNPAVDTFPFTINKSDLTITGDNDGTTDLYLSPPINQGDDIFHLGAVSNVTICYIWFYNCCFAITDVSTNDSKTNISINHCKFTSCRNAGDPFQSAYKYGYDGGAIHLTKISNSNFYSNYISLCGEGIYLDQSNYNNVHDNVITENFQFGIRLNTQYNDNSIDHNLVEYCQDRGIVLYDPGSWDNVSHYVGWNTVRYCNAEGILILGAGDPDDYPPVQYSLVEYNCVHDNCRTGWYAVIQAYDDDGVGNEGAPISTSNYGGTWDTNYTNLAGIAIHTCRYIGVYYNSVWDNGELNVNCAHTCVYGGLAMLNSKNIIIERNVFYGNTGDYGDGMKACGVFLVNCHWGTLIGSNYYQDTSTGSHMAYNDLYYELYPPRIQYYGARNTSFETCFSAQHNWWNNCNGPDDQGYQEYPNGCASYYNPNPLMPKVDDKITYSEWECNETAIELKEFSASPYTGNSIICNWVTASEKDNVGFYLVKSEYLTKGYSLVNSKIIPANGSSVGGKSYSYVDSKISPNTLYYYWLIDVDYSGTLSLHGPVSVICESSDSICQPLVLR